MVGIMQKNLKQIVTFLQVVDSGSFTKAADSLGLSRSMVSIDIKNLEQKLNISLLIRNTRSIALTEAGRQFYNDFKYIQSQIEDAFEKTQHSDSIIKGILRFSSTNEFGQQFILPLLADFCCLYPQLNLQYYFNSSLDDLIADKLDLAIRLGNLGDSTLKSRKIAEYDIYLIASPQFIAKNPINQLADLSQVAWITHTRLNWQVSQFKLKDQQGIEYPLPLIHGAYAANSTAIIRSMTLDSLGVAICPSWLVKEDIEQKKLIHLFPELSLPKQSIQILYPNRVMPPAKTRVFIDYLIEKLQQQTF